jgi:hypothetical protein
MRQQKKDYSPFKNRLQTRRLCEVGNRRDSRRSRLHKGQIAGVLVRIG